MNNEFLQQLMVPIVWWFEFISSVGSQSLGLTWACWLQQRVLTDSRPSVCFIFQTTKLENALLFVAGEFNVHVGMLKFLFGLVAAFPMALLIRMIPCTLSSLKHFIGAIGGMCVLQFVFGRDWLHPVITSFGTYLLFFLVPRKHLPVAVTLWSLGSSYYRYFYDSWPVITLRFILSHSLIHSRFIIQVTLSCHIFTVCMRFITWICLTLHDVKW